MPDDLSSNRSTYRSRVEEGGGNALGAFVEELQLHNSRQALS